MTSVSEARAERPELSVVVLCYRVEDLARQFVEQIVSELTEAGIQYELVLVANYWPGSNDRTPEIVKAIAAANPRCRVVAKAKGGMMGWDMRSGLNEATGEHICVIDGDGQMPSSDIVKVYRFLRAGRYDLVKTFRAQRFDGLYRRVISAVYNWLFRLLFRPKAKFHDVNSKPKVMTRAAFDRMRLESSDWFTDAEIMIEALRINLKIGEVSTIFLKNERRASFVPLSAILEFLRNLLYYRFKRRPSDHG
ncbi:glycosyltransferase family 2 protein [Candidatus Parcubacteria bacterium]|nr:glycosyltransferase family 2 protein [Candidatus Parcubacteria bacterium]